MPYFSYSFPVRTVQNYEIDHDLKELVKQVHRLARFFYEPQCNSSLISQMHVSEPTTRGYWLKQLRRSKREVEVVLGVHVELDRLVGGLEPRSVDLEVNRPVVRLLDDVHLDAERLRHRLPISCRDRRLRAAEIARCIAVSQSPTGARQKRL